MSAKIHNPKSSDPHPSHDCKEIPPGTSLYTVVDGEVIAADVKTSQTLWTQSLKGATNSPPVATTGSRLYASDSYRVYAFDSQSGSIKWVTRADSRITTPLSVDDSHIYFVTHNKEFCALDRETGSKHWSIDITCPSHGAYVYMPITGDLLFCSLGSYKLVCISLSKREIIHEKKLGLKHASSSMFTPAASNNHLLIVDNSGSLNVLNIKNMTFREKSTPERIIASPAVSGNTAYTMDSRGVFAYNINSMETEWACKGDIADRQADLFATPNSLVVTTINDVHLLNTNKSETMRTQWVHAGPKSKHPEQSPTVPVLFQNLVFSGATVTMASDRENTTAALYAISKDVGKQPYVFQRKNVWSVLGAERITTPAIDPF
jgi:outer membrane protein assembly factor BamB